MKKIKIRLLLYLFIALLTLLFSVNIHKNITIEFEVENPQQIRMGEFYYDSSNGAYSHKIFSYKDNIVKVVLKENFIKSLRYDPMPSLGSLFIKNIKINGEIVRDNEVVLRPLHNIKKVVKIDESRYHIVSSGEDPYMIFIENIQGKYNYSNISINYFSLFFGLLLFGLLYFKMLNFSTIDYKDTRKIKLYILTYTSVFFIFIISFYFYKLHLSSNIFLSLLFFDRFFDEFIIIFFLLLIFFNKYKLSIFIGSLFFISYIIVNFAQLTTVMISGEFLSKLAIDNIEFIGLMINKENIINIAALISVTILLPLIIACVLVNYSKKFQKIILSKYFYIFIFGIGLVVHFNNKLLSDPHQKELKKLYNENRMEHTAPIQALAKVLKKHKKTKYNFTSQDIQMIKELGFSFNPFQKYPLEKEFIYHSKKNSNEINKPNIIVIFTEGYSARTCNVYNDKFKDLTPNLVEFANDKNSMVVDKYFNHTAATYRGLHGQLCSLYPKFGGVGGWHDNIENLPKVDYLCVPHILDRYNYDTAWLNMHYENASSNDEMVSHFGFKEILSAEELLKNFLNKTQGERKDFLTDHESYQILTNYLKSKEELSKPFMIGIYTVETHAWVDTSHQGIKYQDGNFNGLNTIHNMDDAFGKFWKYFRNSKFADNTIVVFTSDHAHYYEKSYVNAMKDYKEKDYKKIFADKVPLIIYNPVKQLPKKYMANSATTVDLAPTLLSLLNINNEKNAFMGNSIFELSKQHIGIISIGDDHFIVKNGEIYDLYNLELKDKKLHDISKKFIKYSQYLEINNRIINK